MRPASRIQPACSDQSRRQRQEGSREPVQVHLAPATRQRPPQDPRRRKREAGVETPVVGWHLVDRPCAACPHCEASRDHPPSSSPCRQIFGGHLVTLQPPQPDPRACPPCHPCTRLRRARRSPRRGRARGKRQAPFTLHFLEPASQKDVRDRHRLPSLQNPSPPHRHDRDRGHHQKDSLCHGATLL